MKRAITVTLSGERGALWERAIGTRTLPVTTFAPIKATLGPDKEEAEVYLVDLEALEGNQLAQIALTLAQKSGENPREVMEALIRDGLPIKAGDDAIAALHDPQRWI